MITFSRSLCSVEHLISCHETAQFNALQFYKKRAVGRQALDYQTELEIEMTKIFNEYKELNMLESKELCVHLAETLYNLKLAHIMEEETAVRDSKFMVAFKREWEVFSASYEGIHDQNFSIHFFFIWIKCVGAICLAQALGI